MNTVAVARSFAKALLESALDAGEVEAVSADILRLQEEYGAAPALRAYCRGRHASTPEAREETVRELWEGAMHPLTMTALRQMARWDALPAMPYFLRSFQVQRDRAVGRHVARAAFAVAPTEAELDALRAKLAPRYPGESVVIEAEVRPELLAGFQVDVDGFSIDASLSGRLHRSFGF